MTVFQLPGQNWFCCCWVRAGKWEELSRKRHPLHTSLSYEHHPHLQEERQAGSLDCRRVSRRVRTSGSLTRSHLGSFCLNVSPQVAVVDTPGWLSRCSTPDWVSRELVRSLKVCRPGPHVILLVVPTFRAFGQEQWWAMEAQLRRLETPVWRRAMVLFTQRDALGKPTITAPIYNNNNNFI